MKYCKPTKQALIFLFLVFVFTYIVEISLLKNFSNGIQIGKNFIQSNLAQSKYETYENQFFEAWEKSPADLYFTLSERKKVASQNKLEFEMPEMSITIDKIRSDINFRLSEPNEYQALNNVERKKLSFYSQQFKILLDNHVPYKQTIKVVYSYLEFMDAIFKRLDPQLPKSIAKLLTENEFSNLHSASNAFIFFSFRPIDIEFFVKTRSAPIYIIGLLEYPSFQNPQKSKVKVDGFETEIGGFSHHDAEHARTDYRLDLKMLDEELSVENALLKWNKTKNILLSKLKALQTSNPELAQAVIILLFEMLHERGLQYDPAYLKPYLNSEVYLQTTKDKWNSQFWDPLPGKPEIMHIFSDAHHWLNNQISEILVKQNLESLNNTQNPTISILEKITMKDGYVKNIEVLNTDDVKVWLTPTLSKSSILSIASLYNIKTFGLVEIDSNDSSFVHLANKSHFLQAKYNQLIKLKNSNSKLSYKIVEPKHHVSDELVDWDHEKIFLKSAQGKTYTVSLDSVKISN